MADYRRSAAGVAGLRAIFQYVAHEVKRSTGEQAFNSHHSFSFTGSAVVFVGEETTPGQSCGLLGRRDSGTSGGKDLH